MAANPEPGRRGGAGPTASPPVDPDADNYYQLLGVPYTATGAEITRAYRAAMKRTHPDRHRPERRAAAEERAKQLNRAYATLSKPLPRQAYDRTIRAAVVQDQLMGRYVGGFGVPQSGNGPDPVVRPPRPQQTPAQKREQAVADRNALVSIVVVFGGLAFLFVALLLLWAVARSLAGAAL